MNEVQKELRKLPSVDRLMSADGVRELIQGHGHELVLEAAREVLEEARKVVLAGEKCPPLEGLSGRVCARLAEWLRPSLCPLINATGVIIHTNLGRAPLSAEARAAMDAVAHGYSNLEFDMEAGRRGSRYVHAEGLLRRLTGAEAALVVNNNAAAVLLILTALAKDKEVIISRSQLVEIGGGFRIPDVMRQSGARLVEVGTTNRTYLWDYEAAIGPETALLMRVHHSNFRLIGFTHEVGLGELVALGRKHGLKVVDDLGSGTFLDTARYGLAHEPIVQESLEQGADLVSFSGDKLLGGPQAGIIVGRKELIASLKHHPLTRALRVDKTTLAGLNATLRHYLEGVAEEKIPIWRMISAPLSEIEARARAWAERLPGAQVREGRSTVGGGSLPEETFPTKVVAFSVPSPDELARRLRLGEPGVVGRIEEDLFILDPRTVLPEQEGALLEAVERALADMGYRSGEKSSIRLRASFT